MIFSCFAVYVLANNTQVVPYFESCMVTLGDYTRRIDDRNMVQQGTGTGILASLATLMTFYRSVARRVRSLFLLCTTINP